MIDVALSSSRFVFLHPSVQSRFWHVCYLFTLSCSQCDILGWILLYDRIKTKWWITLPERPTGLVWGLIFRWRTLWPHVLSTVGSLVLEEPLNHIPTQMASEAKAAKKPTKSSIFQLQGISNMRDVLGCIVVCVVRNPSAILLLLLWSYLGALTSSSCSLPLKHTPSASPTVFLSCGCFHLSTFSPGSLFSPPFCSTSFPFQTNSVSFSFCHFWKETFPGGCARIVWLCVCVCELEREQRTTNDSQYVKLVKAAPAGIQAC